jgi:hypothetical protein
VPNEIAFEFAAIDAEGAQNLLGLPRGIAQNLRKAAGAVRLARAPAGIIGNMGKVFLYRLGLLARVAPAWPALLAVRL